MEVDGIVWGMWHAWEINVYIVWWEHLKERDCFGNLCVDGQIILNLIWKIKGDVVGGEEAFWAGYVWLEDKWQWTPGIHHISTIYMWTVSFVLQPHYSMEKSFLCSLVGTLLSMLLTWQPVFLQTELWSCMRSHLLYHATTAHMMSCTNRVLTQ